MSKITFNYTILYVEDVQKSLAFYQDCFDFKILFTTDEGDYGELDTGTTKIAFAKHDFAQTLYPEEYSKVQTTTKPVGFEMAFTVENVEEMLEKCLSKGATILAKPVVKPWKQTVAYIRDINGFVIEICTPMPE